ncbi:MAG: hypothetical protein J6V76_04080 [Bacteroidales bacterium]|nr:hypothetical protein [Bacteroidales bacterium]
MSKFFAIIFFVAAVAECFASGADTLKHDTLMNTASLKVMFKGGFPVTLNSQGYVVEGVLAAETDLWTTGPLVSFAAGFKIKLNNDGKVYEGFTAVNFIAQACNGTFYELKANTPVAFNNAGMIIEGSPAQGLEYVCNDGTRIFSEPGTDVKFYPSGQIKRLTLAETTKLSINKDEKISFMGLRSVQFDMEGFVIQGTTAKKATFVTQNGTTVVKTQGEIVKFDSHGMLIE